MMAPGVHRGVEVFVGLLAAGGGAASFVVGVRVLRSIAEGGFDGNGMTAKAFTLLLSLPLSMWCAQMAWRLWSGRGRAGTKAQLSPVMYAMTGVALLALFGVQMAGRHQPSVAGATVFVAAALGLFGLAGAQRRAERRSKGP